MRNDITSLVKRSFVAVGRRTPYLRRVFHALDAERTANAALSAERDHLIAALQQSERQREQSQEAQWHAQRERQEAEIASQKAETALRKAEEASRKAEETRRAAVAALEVANSRWKAVSRGQDSASEDAFDTEIDEIDWSSTTEGSETAPQNVGLSGGDRRAFEPNGAKISIVLANYNHGRFIRNNIEAVRAQTYPNWELVIVDDGSTDDSRAIIEAYRKLDPRIMPIFLPDNHGVQFAVETGLAATTGALLYGSAADDYISNERFFELAIAALVEHPQASGVFGKASVIAALSSEKLWEMGSSPAHGFIAPHLALKAFLTGDLFVPGAAAIWKRADVDALGGFDPSLGPQIDFFLNHALPAMNGAVFIDDVFTTVRVGEENYHRSASHEEFFRRHALVESKLRSLGLPSHLDLHWLRTWRERLVNSRLAVTRQRAFFYLVRIALTDVEPWEWASLPPNFVECSKRLLADVSRLEQDLADRVSSAHQVLDAVAGTLSRHGESKSPAVAGVPFHPVGVDSEDGV